MSFKLGMNCKLYINDGTYETPNWTEVTNCKDLTRGGTTGTADVTTRGNNGWRALVATLKEGTIDFGMVYDTEDANYNTLASAWEDSTTVEVAVADADIDTSGTRYFRATCMVTKFDEDQALENAVITSVSLSPTYADNAPEFVTVGS